MSCLDNIIGIKAPCSPDTAPLSGMFITDYPGITLKSASNVADERTMTGYAYLVDLRRRAMQKLNNDVLAFINKEYKVNTIATNRYQSGSYNTPYTTISAGSSSQRRGIVIGKIKTWCRFHKIIVNKVRIYAAESKDVILHISDVGAGVTYPATVSLEANVVNEFVINKTIVGNEVQITIPSDTIVYSNKPECGCGGRPKNEYLIFNGLSNSAIIPTEGYGIEADITLKCDISTLVCDLANDQIIGQAAYELCGAMFYDDMLRNNRMNYLTIYKGDEMKDQSLAAYAAYASYLESAMDGLTGYIARNDGNCRCVDCGGMQIKPNI